MFSFNKNIHSILTLTIFNQQCLKVPVHFIFIQQNRHPKAIHLLNKPEDDTADTGYVPDYAVTDEMILLKGFLYIFFPSSITYFFLD